MDSTELSFGKRLLNIRLERNLSQEQFAKLLNTSKQVISRYERDERTPKITVANEFALKLGIPLQDLIDTDTEQETSKSIMTNEQVKILSYMDKLNHTGQEEAVKRVEDLTYVDKYKKDDEPKLYRMVAESGNLILPMTDKIKKQLIENAKNAPDVSKDLDY